VSLFQNGHGFLRAIRCAPPTGKSVPWVKAELTGPSQIPTTIVGKIDTGAFRTFLTVDTAHRLGIGDPAASPIGPGKTKSATGHEVAYYVHAIRVRIAGSGPNAIRFSLRAAVSKDIRNDLFGMDWLAHVCLAVDLQAVHVLAD